MSFSSETKVKATRKEARCIACNAIIPSGSPAVRWAGTTDGDFNSVIYHVDCRKAEIAWNREAGSGWDDWYSLSEMEWDDWPWLLDKAPAVAARMNVTQERYDKIAAEQERCRLAFAKTRSS